MDLRHFINELEATAPGEIARVTNRMPIRSRKILDDNPRHLYALWEKNNSKGTAVLWACRPAARRVRQRVESI